MMLDSQSTRNVIDALSYIEACFFAIKSEIEGAVCIDDIADRLIGLAETGRTTASELNTQIIRASVESSREGHDVCKNR